MKNKFFFVIYLHDKTLKSLLDAIRLVADPQQKNLSHITVKGPYKTNQKKILNEDNEEIMGTELKVTGASNFFDESQNTVFWECEDNADLYRIWKKKEEKTYNSFHPHITIYDGADREYAENIYKIVSSYNISFSFNIDKLELYSSRDKGTLFNLRTQVDYSLISKLAHFDINQENIDGLNTVERMQIIESLCNSLEKVANHHKEYNDEAHSKEMSLLLDA